MNDTKTENKSFYMAGWGCPFCSRKDYEFANEAGINHFLVVENYSETGEFTAGKELEFAKAAGITSVMHVGNDYGNSTKGTMRKFDTDYNAYSDMIDRICYSDEPIYTNFSLLKEWAKKHDEKYGDTLAFYVNLLLIDMYPREMGDTEETQTYENYVGKFCSEVLSEIKKGKRILSCDCYPILTKEGKITVRKNWLRGLEVMMENAKTYGARHEEYVQVVEHLDFPKSTEESIRYQIYVLLNFETSGFTYFTYSSSLADYKNSCVNLDKSCSPNDEYYFVKTVNTEIRAFENEYLHCSVDGVMPIYGTKNSLGEDSAMARIKRPARTLGGVASITATEDTLVSGMTRTDGKKAILVTNFSNPYDGRIDSVEIKLDDDSNLTKYTLYRKGKREECDAKEGKIWLDLEAGEGVFILL